MVVDQTLGPSGHGVDWLCLAAPIKLYNAIIVYKVCVCFFVFSTLIHILCANYSIVHMLGFKVGVVSECNWTNKDGWKVYMHCSPQLYLAG